MERCVSVSAAPHPTPDVNTWEGRNQALDWLKVLFEPSRPINRKELFAGRKEECARFSEAVTDPGRHVVVYGERGVGKTSLGLVMQSELEPDGTAIRIGCSPTDSFAAVWTAALSQVTLPDDRRGPGFVTTEDNSSSAVEWIGDRRPRDVTSALARVASERKAVVFLFDEFDQLAPHVRRLFAHTIKMLSDDHVRATVVAIGIADTVDELMDHHGSMPRTVEQIEMPRMSTRELNDIITRGYEPIGLTIDQAARSKIVRLSHGLPNYTHRLARDAARIAVGASSSRVTREHVDEAVNKATESLKRSMAVGYHAATACATDTELYEHVLLAAALARHDVLGYFQAADVQRPLAMILGRPISLPEFSDHLDAMAESDRGPALHRRPASNHDRYRFCEPMLQPWVIMRGLHTGALTQPMFDRLNELPY